jgi:hypothetical protein
VPRGVIDTSQHSSGTPGDYAITAAVADATVNGEPRQLWRSRRVSVVDGPLQIDPVSTMCG